MDKTIYVIVTNNGADFPDAEVFDTLAELLDTLHPAHQKQVQEWEDHNCPCNLLLTDIHGRTSARIVKHIIVPDEFQIVP